ncbi:DNA replication protein psf2 [Mortierella antarctica]|nr:DNA replication protein psf2 [Mortierella antarctica]
MALPRHLKNGLTPLEIEFLAENELIEIAASIDTKQNLELLGFMIDKKLRSVQPANGIRPVFFWILPIESLQKSLKDEQEQEVFSALPYHYMETAQLLLENACDDIPSADAVRTLLKDLREARQSKARKGVEALGLTYIQMDNIGLMEINEIRPFFTKAFYELQKLKPAGDANDVYGAPEPYRDFDGTASFSSSMLDPTRQ